jgi:hypothetical protein
MKQQLKHAIGKITAYRSLETLRRVYGLLATVARVFPAGTRHRKCMRRTIICPLQERVLPLPRMGDPKTPRVGNTASVTLRRPWVSVHS